MKRSSPDPVWLADDDGSSSRFAKRASPLPLWLADDSSRFVDNRRRCNLAPEGGSVVSSSPSPPPSTSCFGDHLFRPLFGPGFFLGNNNNNTEQRSSSSSSRTMDTSWGSGGTRARGAERTTTTTTTTETKVQEDDAADPTLVLAETMNDLSIQEREQAYEDLHGVSEVIQETSELITQSIQQMEEHILMISDKHAYDLAVTIDNGTYVHDSQLLLMFLRADRFDSQKASKRFITWLDWKLQLFGTSKLCSTYIYLHDLDDDTRYMVESGFFQILPTRDSRGRVVIVIAAGHKYLFFRTSKCIVQMFFYMNLCVMQEDVNNQKYGIVYIIDTLGEDNKNQPIETNEMKDSKRQSASLNSTTPHRIEAVHFLKSDSILKHPITLVVQTFSRFIQARVRIHLGSRIECNYDLLSFGIPSTLLPFTTEGELKFNNHKKWIQRRLVRDYEMQRNLTPMNPTYTFPGIELPHRNDVLFGQGKSRQTHPGNQRFNELIQSYLEEYNQTCLMKDQLRDVLLKVIYEFKTGRRGTTNGSGDAAAAAGGGGSGGSGGRFLKLRKDERKSGWWEEETIEKVLLEKVLNAFRNARAKTRTTTKTVRR